MGFFRDFLEDGMKKMNDGLERARQMSDNEILYYLHRMEQPDHQYSTFDECVKNVAGERGLL